VDFITLLTTGTWRIILTLTYLPPDMRPNDNDEGLLTIGFLSEGLILNPYFRGGSWRIIPVDVSG